MTTETADLFDLDDLLGNEIVSNDPVESVKTPPENNSSAEPIEPSHRRRATCPAGILFIDLETIPDYSRESLFDLPAVPQPIVYAGENEGPAPSELIKETVEEVKAAIAKAQASGKKLPRVILNAAIAVEQKRPKPRKGVVDLFGDMISAIDNESAVIQSAIDARRKTMSVTPEMCRIVSFGWAMSNDPVEASVFGAKGSTTDHDTYEKAVIKKFWELAKRAKTIVGFNHVGFDLNVLYIRSGLLNVDPTRMIDSKPWGGEVVDVMQARWPRGGQMKQKTWAKVLGIPIPAGDMDGSQVEETLKAEPAKVAEYNRSDVVILREIYLTFKGIYW